MSGMTYTLKQLRRLADAYCSATGARPSALGRSICGNAIVLPRIIAREGCQAETAEAITVWFDQNWPEALPWPEGMPRNPPQIQASRDATPASSALTIGGGDGSGATCSAARPG